MIGGDPVTDFHLHVQPWSMLRPAVRARLEEGGGGGAARILRFQESPVRLLEWMDEAGVERAVIVNYVAPDVMGFTEEVNEWCARYCAQAPDRLIAFGSVHPRYCRDVEGETQRVLDRGIRGLKIHPPHQLFHVNDYRTGGPGATVEQLYRVAEQRGVPVMIHTGTSVFPGARNVYADPMPADDVAVDFPRLQLVLAHAGRPLHADAAFFLARRHPNVWLDLSGIPPRRLLHYLPQLEKIASRCLWGSDWPGPGVPDPPQLVREFRSLALRGATARAILHENSLRLFP